MSKVDYPVTPTTRLLKEKKIFFSAHLYPYEDHGGTRVAAIHLRIPERAVIKTLVMETETGAPLLILMHGDREVSTKQLARLLGVKEVRPCSPQTAHQHTGYEVGGISPFGTRKRLPVYVEKTIFELNRVFINGGKRGFLMEIDPEALRQVFPAQEVKVARSNSSQ